MAKECERANGMKSKCDGELVTLVYPSGWLDVVACEWHASIIEAGF